MAEELKEFTFPTTRGRAPKYDYDKILNGNPWRIKQGEDFDSKVESFISALGQQARKRGLKLVSAKESDSVIVVQAVEKG